MITQQARVYDLLERLISKAMVAGAPKQIVAKIWTYKDTDGNYWLVYPKWDHSGLQFLACRIAKKHDFWEVIEPPIEATTWCFVTKVKPVELQDGIFDNIVSFLENLLRSAKKFRKFCLTPCKRGVGY